MGEPNRIESGEFPKITTVEEAVKLFVDSKSYSDQTVRDNIVDYLRQNRDDITEFCIQVVESFSEEGKMGIIMLSGLLRDLIEKK